MVFFSGLPCRESAIPKIRITTILDGHNFLCKPLIKVMFQTKLYPSSRTFQHMSHTSYTHVIQDDSQLLVVRNQIDILIPDPSFGHNLCCKYSNGSWEFILNIYVLRTFQWYKEIPNPIIFDPSNRSLKIWDFVKTPISKVGVHLGVCGLTPSHSPTLSEVWMWLPGCTFGSHLSMPALVMNPILGSWQSHTRLESLHQTVED